MNKRLSLIGLHHKFVENSTFQRLAMTYLKSLTWIDLTEKWPRSANIASAPRSRESTEMINGMKY
jgi:hypothetical protein